MKKILVAMFAVGFLAAAPAFAQMGMMQGFATDPVLNKASDAAISAALQDIYTVQKVTATSQINCAKVTDAQLEKLGDATMGYGITEQQHTAMENMMGGEGSATLRTAHINMGRAFLDCWAGFSSAPAGMPMMGNSGFFGPHPFGMMGAGHMGYGAYSWFGGITMLLVWVLLILGIAALVKWLKHSKN